MAYSHSPRTVTDGLVFYYDLANQLKSYKGEPTTNLIPQMAAAIGGNTSLSYPQTVYISTALETNVIDPTAPGGQYSRFTGDTDSANNQLYTRFNSAGIDVRNTTITYSVYLKGSGTCHLTIYADNTGYGTSSTITLTNEWTRYSYTSAVTNYTTNCWVAVRGLYTSTDVYVAAQQAEIKAHATQFVNGTRSSTEGLLDLTGNKTINLSNVSFDSNAKMYFDGTDDRIDMSLYHLSGSSHTEELVVYRAASGVTHGLVSDLQYGFYGIYMHANNKVYYRQMQQNPGQTPEYPSVTLASTNTFGVGYHHIVGVYSNSFGFRVYVNGNLEASSSTILPFNLAGGRGITHLGVYKDTNAATYGYPLNGRIELFKAYNRELSPEEVAQNFNAVRARYAI